MSDHPLIAIRVEAGHDVGTGHLVRCLTLAEALIERGAEVVVVSPRLPMSLQDRVARFGASLAELPPGRHHGATRWPEDAQIADAEATLAVLPDQIDLVVVDHYGLDATWESRIGVAATRVAVIDDLADRPHDAALLLDQNWYGPGTAHRYDGLVADDATLLLGPRYALLQPAYRHAREQQMTTRDGPCRIVVSFGGSDPTNETVKLLLGAGPALHEARVHLDVVVGGAADNQGEVERLGDALPNVQVHRDLPSLAPLLGVASLAVGAGGTTTWERICLGIPALVTVVAENQRAGIEALAAVDAVRSLGRAAKTTAETYANAVRRALEGGAPSPPALVDGWGAARLALALTGDAADEVTTRAATRSDAPVFIGPDADGGTAESYLDGPHVWRRQQQLFDEALTSNAAHVVCVADVPAGGVLQGPDGAAQERIDLSLPTNSRHRARSALAAIV